MATTGGMSNYGTIPTAEEEGIGRQRASWKMMFNLRSLGVPSGGVSEVVRRVKENVGYFQMNYAMVALLVVFLSLLWFPISLIVFVILMAAWLFIYFLRDQPLVIFGRPISDRLVLILMAVLTVVLLLLTGPIINILVALLIALLFTLLHASFRLTDDYSIHQQHPTPLSPPLLS